MNMKTILMGAMALTCVTTFGGILGSEGGVLGARKNMMRTTSKRMVANKLRECEFLLNKDFKKDAKVYLCLFSASWCGPCRREMPRIAKTYAETLQANPNIELIHFSYDSNEERALAWAKENNVKFPVVKRTGANPLNLKTNGIPHLFIVSADGKVLEEGHPMDVFTDKKLSELK